MGHPERRRTDNRSRVDIANRLTMVTVQGNLARARIEGKIRLMLVLPGGQAQDFRLGLTGFWISTSPNGAFNAFARHSKPLCTTIRQQWFP
jgi:hypothetical protein